MNKQRMIWFQDGVKLKAPWNHWNNIDQFTKTLISKVGQPDFDHIVVDPIECINSLLFKLSDQEFSCIIDLSGFIGKKAAKEFSVPISDTIHLSRLRNISSARLDGSGFILNLSPNQIDQIKSTFDLSRPLILDDVSWSGRTVLETVRIFSLDAHSVTAGLLAVNEGNFGESKPGAAQLLRRAGISLVAGEEVFSPNDDGFHLADFSIPEPSEDIFDTFIQIQRLRETGMESAVFQLLSELQTSVFPHAISSQEAQQLQSEGRLIASGGISRNAHFDINPPNWLMPSFSRRVSSTMLQSNRDGIIDSVRELRSILNPDKEVQAELRAETSFRRRVERL